MACTLHVFLRHTVTDAVDAVPAAVNELVSLYDMDLDDFGRNWSLNFAAAASVTVEVPDDIAGRQHEDTNGSACLGAMRAAVILVFEENELLRHGCYSL